VTFEKAFESVHADDVAIIMATIEMKMPISIILIMNIEGFKNLETL